MDTKALREFVSVHPQGVVIKMVDGTRYTIRHRDFIQFTPVSGVPESRVLRVTTVFAVYHEESFRLVNALLVAEVVPLTKGSVTGDGPGGRQNDPPEN
ncbi:MAG: hypothetical protein ACKVZJ_01110 [Phycisphaerales bacterium]